MGTYFSTVENQVPQCDVGSTADSILPNISQIQDSYSNFQVQSQQEEHVNLEKSMKFMIQSKNNNSIPNGLSSISQ